MNTPQSPAVVMSLYGPILFNAVTSCDEPLISRILTGLNEENKKRIIMCQDNTDGSTLFMAACDSGSRDVVQLLYNTLPARAQKNVIRQTNHSGVTCLMIAARQGHNEVVELLLEKLDMDQSAIIQTNKSGHSAVTMAVFNYEITVVQTLLNSIRDKQAAIVQVNAFGRNTVMVAVNKGYLEITKLLLDSLTNKQEAIDVADPDNITTLMKAVQTGNTRLVQLLLNNLTDKENALQRVSDGEYTALMFAAYFGYWKIVQLLLDHSLRCPQIIHMKNADGNTALMLAEKRTHQQLAQDVIKTKITLLEYGACSGEKPNDIVSAVHTILADMASNNIDLSVPEFSDGTFSPTIITNRCLLDIEQQDGQDWVSEYYDNYSSHSPELRVFLDQITKWAIILGKVTLVDSIVSRLENILTLEACSQQLYWALKAQKFAVASSLLEHTGAHNQELVLNGLRTFMTQKQCSAAEFILAELDKCIAAKTLVLYNQSVFNSIDNSNGQTKCPDCSGWLVGSDSAL